MMNRIRKFLCTLSGDDYGIIAQCRIGRQNGFAIIGFSVLLIFILCFLSSYITFTKLFQSYLIGIPAGLFFSFMITNLYLLILYTLTKNVLPHSMSKGAMLVSIVLRIVFVWFIAIIVSKPLEVIAFSGNLDADVASHRSEQLENFRESTGRYFLGETESVRSIIANIEAAPGPVDVYKLERYRNLLAKKRPKKRY